MDEEFERAKSYIIEGLEALITFYGPYLRLIQGFKMLVPHETLFSNEDVVKAMELYEQMDLVAKTWLSEVKGTSCKEELLKVAETNGEFMLRFLGH